MIGHHNPTCNIFLAVTFPRHGLLQLWHGTPIALFVSHVEVDNIPELDQGLDCIDMLQLIDNLMLSLLGAVFASMCIPLGIMMLLVTH